MKKIKIIPLLAAVSLLAGCTVQKVDSAKSSPKFAKEKQEVTFDKFEEIRNAEYFYNNFDKLSKDNFPDFVVENTEKMLMEETVKRGKEKISYSSTATIEKVTVNGDVNGNAFQTLSEETVAVESSNRSGNSKMEIVSKSDRQRQISKVDVEGEEKYYLVDVNNSAKEYSLSTDFTSMSEEERSAALHKEQSDQFYYTLRISKIVGEIEDYKDLSDEEKAGYKFYADGKLLTITSTKEQTVDVKNLSDDVIGSRTLNTECKIQVDATKEDTILFKLLQKETETINYTVDYKQHKAGDVITSYNQRSVDSKGKQKEVDVGLVDISSYEKVTYWY